MNNADDLSRRPLGWGTRFSYACGDTACNIVWGAISTILVLFYTDYAGVSAATVGLVMLLSRIFDGLFDVIMGLAVEKTNSKWGKSRPWILWMSVPFAVSIILMFTVPQTSEALQFLYIFLTYNFCTSICYTAINLPYGSLSAMMTRLSHERDMLCIVRMGMAPLGKILAVSATLPLIKIFGGDQAAWIKVMVVWAIVALALLLICFFNCHETVKIKARQVQKKLPVKKLLVSLVKNKYFWIVLVLWAMQNVIFAVTGTILPYYCKYIFQDESLFSVLFLTETLVLVSMTMLSPLLLKKFGKRNMSLAGAIFALVGHLLYFLNPLDFTWVLMSCVIRGIGLAPLNSVVFGFLGEVIEYGQWKFHVRQEGMIFAGGTIGAKTGSGLAIAIVTGLLSLVGYASSSSGVAAQSQAAIDMVVYIYMFGPIIVWIITIIALLLYKLDKIYPQIMRDLINREARGEL